MEAIPQKVARKPEKCSPQEAILRCRLLVEEVLELCDAAGVEIFINDQFELNFDKLTMNRLLFQGGENQDLVEIADGLTDIDYVTEGAANTWGIPLQECFDAVHENNMLKTVNPTRDENGKLKKPVDHPRVDLKSILFPEEFSIGDEVKIISLCLTKGKIGFITGFDSGKFEVSFDESWVGWYSSEELQKTGPEILGHTLGFIRKG